MAKTRVLNGKVISTDSPNHKVGENFIERPNPNGSENPDPVSTGVTPLTGEQKAISKTLQDNSPVGTPPTNVPSQPSPTNLPKSDLPGAMPNQSVPVAPTATPATKISPAQASLNAAQASGVPAPQDAGQARLQGAQFVAPKAPDTSNIDQSLQADPGYQQLLADRAEYTKVANQGQSLLKQYDQMVKQAGIPAINKELLNTKNIIDGTEDDIRKEVQAASGFATNSQVLALASSRNKQLIQNYNNLLDTKSQAMESINTMIGLAREDQQNALQNITQKMNFDSQILDYRDKFVNNAKEGFNNVIKATGYAGLLASLQQDPSSIPLVERTLGLAPGGLEKLANYAPPMSEMDKLDLENKRLQNQKLRNDLNPGSNGIEVPTVKSINGVDKQWNPKTGTWDEIGSTTKNQPLQLAQSEQSISDLDSLIQNPYIRSAVGPTWLGRFIGKGLDTATGDRQNYIASVEKLRSQLSLDSLIQAKAKGATFGALSEGELKVLSNSASKLGSWAKTDSKGNVTAYSASEKDFNNELTKINNFAKLDYILKGGAPENVGVQQMPDGSLVVQNSNGTYTQLQ